jgi:CheY-like chemotaxis protein
MKADARWDIKLGGSVYHHVPNARLRRWIKTGKIKVGEAVVCLADSSDWRKLEDMDDLRPLIKLQATASKKRKRSLSAEKAGPGRKRIQSILLIDDEKDLCALLGNALSSRGFQMEYAHTRGEALKCLAGRRPDLILLDLSLPDGDGLALLSHLRKTRPAPAVIITTAFGSEEVRSEAEKLGASGFLDKPYDEEDVIRKIRKIGIPDGQWGPRGAETGG